MVTVEVDSYFNLREVQIWLEDHVGWVVNYDNFGYVEGIGWKMYIENLGKFPRTIKVEFDNISMESWFLMRWV